MAAVTLDTAVEQLLAVLGEGFEGPPEKWSYFVDNDATAGYSGTLAKVSAAEASHPIGGSTIAAHVHHMIFALEASSAWIRGDRASRNWGESWRGTTVSEKEWAELRAKLQAGYADLGRAIASHARESEEAIGGAIGALAHAAYHLGAIRQKIVCARER
jgi:hypothetical protein